MPSDAEQQRLADIVASGKVIHFFDTTDKEHAEVTWQVYGATETNEIIVGARAGKLEVWHAGLSGLLVPPMIDRRFGLDVLDSAVANRLSEELWAAEGERLLTALAKQKPGA